MLHYLENDNYKVGVKTAGAELSSFRNKQTNLEYIWQADPQIWPRHAPVLFPVVGKLPGGKFSYGGKTYELSQHGFARDLDFTLVSQSGKELIFELKDSEQTKAVYPFPFRLQIIYRLEGNALETTYAVQNPAEADLYFSIGAHPAFNCPLLPGEFFADYYLEFDQPENQAHYLLELGLLNGKTEPLLKNEIKLPLSYDLFLHDALVFKNLASEKIELKNLKHHHGLSFEFKGFPYFGIWTKQPGAGFICLEPWHGIASSVGDNGELTQKEGIKKLAAGEAFSCAYTIRVH
ncbi:aldose 1-epimerase family protein [Adhaeribacter rhizoryzae]|uniref:Aldose 1-epimerase family protein n=1 Tax=Adhaeribacter rhizoryzae TaxID=2607907 RepID=A0A5M6DVG7_9BACT|nr:aldose 1-epimerase family protein [Adhaeribacter rhizoryzae]KAA5549465.1 aldose 1-epimerase family protein [Adhaeribacter rhizoryzae]